MAAAVRQADSVRTPSRPADGTARAESHRSRARNDTVVGEKHSSFRAGSTCSRFAFRHSIQSVTKRNTPRDSSGKCARTNRWEPHTQCDARSFAPANGSASGRRTRSEAPGRTRSERRPAGGDSRFRRVLSSRGFGPVVSVSAPPCRRNRGGTVRGDRSPNAFLNRFPGCRTSNAHKSNRPVRGFTGLPTGTAMMCRANFFFHSMVDCS